MQEDFEEPYVIKDMKKLSQHIGKDVAKSFCIPIKEMKNFIKPKEITRLIKQYTTYSDAGYVINNVTLAKIYDEVKNWVLGIQLARLAGEDLIDSYWDDELNCATFKKEE